MIPVGTSLLRSGVDGDGIIDELNFAGDQAGARRGELDNHDGTDDLRDDTGNGVFLVKVEGLNPVAI